MYYFIGFFWGKQTPVTNQESLILWIYGPSKYTSCSDTPKRKAKNPGVNCRVVKSLDDFAHINICRWHLSC